MKDICQLLLPLQKFCWYIKMTKLNSQQWLSVLISMNKRRCQDHNRREFVKKIISTYRLKRKLMSSKNGIVITPVKIGI